MIPYPCLTLPEQPVDGRLYHNRRRNLLSALIPTPFHSNHACCITELAGGDLLCVWFAGSCEGNGDISVVQSRFDCGSGLWDLASQVTFDGKRAEQNPALFPNPDGTLWLLYPAQLSRQSAQEVFNLQYTSVIRKMVSADQGHSWSPPVRLLEQSGVFSRQPIQVLSSGRWVLPTWYCFDDDTRNGSDITVVQLSDDRGTTWRAVEIPGSRGLVHANLIETSPGKLLALFRSRAADRIYLSRSEDQGCHWTPPIPTELPNNNSGISAARLPSGRLAVVYNEQSFNEDRHVILWPFERSHITIAVSADEGRSWPWRRVVEPGDGYCGRDNLRSNLRYEYPYLMIGRNGALHICYSYASRKCIKHVIVTEDWIYGERQQVDGECKLWN